MKIVVRLPQRGLLGLEKKVQKPDSTEMQAILEVVVAQVAGALTRTNEKLGKEALIWDKDPERWETDCGHHSKRNSVLVSIIGLTGIRVRAEEVVPDLLSLLHTQIGSILHDKMADNQRVWLAFALDFGSARSTDIKGRHFGANEIVKFPEKNPA